MTDEEERARKVFTYLAKFPDFVQDYLRHLMQDTLFRDGILNEFTFGKLIGKRAIALQENDGGAPFEPEYLWNSRCQEAKKQLIDYFYAVNHSIDHLKQLVIDHSIEIESEFGISIDLDYSFNVDMETASTNVLMKKMDYLDSLDPDEKRKHLPEIRELNIVLLKRLITDNPEQVRIAERFLSFEDLRNIHKRMLGSGKVGGKAAGMLIAYKIMQFAEEEDPYNYRDYVTIPESYYLGDEVFIKFLDFNGLLDVRNQKFKPNEMIENEYESIRTRVLQGRFPNFIWNQFLALMEKLDKKPIIVRSSSLLEDSIGVSFAGKYDSYFLPNQGAFRENLDAFAQAIKSIYAGVFSPEPIIYRKRSKMWYDYEAMAILIQDVVGTMKGKYFFPTVAGVIFSENPYLWSRRVRKEDGMIRMVSGLGTRAVDRVGEDYPRMVSLTVPELRPEAQADILKYTQKYLDVIDLQQNKFVTIPFQDALTEEGPMAANPYIYSVRTQDFVRQAITNLDFFDYAPVITFDRLLSATRFPQIIRFAVDKIKKFYGRELDMEFAGIIDHDGSFRLYLLQCRPQSTRPDFLEVKVPEVPEHQVIFRCNREVPSCKVENIQYIVYVDPEEYDKVDKISDRYEIARLVGKINTHMEGRISILLGPGRWGSNNINLGVPVKYNEINNFKLLGEISRARSGIIPEVSFGTHFFQDLIESGIHCIPIYPDGPEAIFRKEFFEDNPNKFSKIVKSNDFARFARIIKVIELAPHNRAHIFLDGKSEEGHCFISDRDMPARS